MDETYPMGDVGTRQGEGCQYARPDAEGENSNSTNREHHPVMVQRSELVSTQIEQVLEGTDGTETYLCIKAPAPMGERGQAGRRMSVSSSSLDSMANDDDRPARSDVPSMTPSRIPHVTAPPRALFHPSVVIIRPNGTNREVGVGTRVW